MAWNEEVKSETDITDLHTDIATIKTAIETASAITITPVTLNAANDTVAAGYYEATTLHAVDADLATANIKAGVTIFGISGKAEVVDTTIAADFAIAGRLKTGDKAYTNGSLITGDGTKTLSDANDTVTAGYYEATTLHAVDADLASANIKSGVTIFGIAGAATVQDIADADLAVGEAPTGKKFYAVTGGVKTGTGTKTLSVANDTVAAGYYAATTLSAVDTDLATANIKSGITIFGISGSSTVKDVSDTTAVAADVKAGTFFYTADGTRTEGTLP